MTAFGTDPKILARVTDPDTSHAAALLVDSTKLEERVYWIIDGYGLTGCISDEVRTHFPWNFPYSSITARYAALIRKGYIVDTGYRRPGKSGRLQRVMIANTI